MTQSDWMATQKTSSSVAAGAHALVYSLPFLLLGPSALGFAVILSTHFLIDRYRLARYVCWAKNFLAPRWVLVGATSGSELQPDGSLKRVSWGGRLKRNQPWSECQATGYPSERPAWLAGC